MAVPKNRALCAGDVRTLNPSCARDPPLQVDGALGLTKLAGSNHIKEDYMKQQDRFRTALAVLFATVLFITISTVAYAGSIGDDPVLRGPCDTPNDVGTIGEVHAMLGEEVGVPVYIGSDNCINNYRFEFKLDSRLTFDSIQWGTCPWVDEPEEPGDNVVVVEHSTGGDCITPDIDDVFFTIWVNTHCGEFHDDGLFVNWGVNDPDNPTIFIGHATCNRDPFTQNNGEVYIDPIELGLTVESKSVLIGQEFTVTVTCDNNFDFTDFGHYLEFDQAYLQLVQPVITPSDWTAGDLNWLVAGDVIMITGNHRPGGYGIPGPDEDNSLYQIHFIAVSSMDNVETFIEFIESGTSFVALDCGQGLQNFVPIVHNKGTVEIPPYHAHFDQGEVIWSSDNTCEFQVPIYLDNNYPVYKFNLSFDYAALGDPLDFVGVVPDPDLQYQALNCTDYNRGDYEFGQVTFLASGGNELQPVTEPVQIGALIFRATTPVSATYVLEVLEFGCDGDFETWVKTWDQVRGETRYAFTDVQTEFTGGTITFEDPLIEISVPGAYANRDCDKWGNCTEDWHGFTSVNVKSNVSLDVLTFRVEWDPDVFCVEEHDLPAGVTVVVNESALYAEWTIYDIPISPDWHSYGSLRFENSTHSEQWGTLDVNMVSYTEPCASEGPITIAENTGDIHMYAVPTYAITCGNDDDIVLKKDSAVPETYGLIQNRPNPFNASTVIEYAMAQPGNVTLDVYNVMGQRVVRLVDEYIEAGAHTVRWNGRDRHGVAVASGIYFYRLQANDFVESKKMILLK